MIAVYFENYTPKNMAEERKSVYENFVNIRKHLYL
jgi:hypothetical protein